MESDLRIGELAKSAGTSAPTIRYYEQIGLMAPASRPSGGQRAYGRADVRRLTFIRQCRDFGFSIVQTRQLAGLIQDPGRRCDEAKALAQQRLNDIRDKLRELKALERSVAQFLRDCDDASCLGGAGPDCSVLAGLAEPHS